MKLRRLERGLADSALYLGFPLWAWFCFTVLGFIKIWLVSGHTLFAIGGNVHDDMLFLNLANALIEGNWIGNYTQITLIKGPFYPLWIASIHLLRIPLLLAQHLLYVTACITFGISVRPLLRNTPVVILLFTLLLFNPMSYANGPMTRVIREGIYPALTIFVIASAVGFLVRYSWSRIRLTSWSTSLGLALSAFWLTREEGVWIMPFIIIVMSLAVLKIWWKTSVDWLKISLCALPFALLFMSIGAVATLNKIHYGVFSVVELNSSELLAAYGALTRVKHTNWLPTIPVPSETREQIYKVSPAFAELRPFFEADIGGWSSVIHNLRERMRKDPVLDKEIKTLLKRDGSHIWSTEFSNDRRELIGGCFLWTLRYAVAAAGYHASGRTAADYYLKLSKEVNLACDEGRLSCLPKRASLMPPWHGEYAGPFFRTMVDALIYLVTFEGFTAKSSPSRGSHESLMTFRDLTGERLSPSRFQIRGWAFSPYRDISLSIRTESGMPILPIEMNPSPDVYQHFLSKGTDIHNSRKARFDVTGEITGIFAPCGGTCYLCITADEQLIERIPLDKSIMSVNSPNLYFHLDFLGSKDEPSRNDNIKLEILSYIAKIYQLIIPILFCLALLSYVITTTQILRDRTIQTIWVISTATLISILARSVILSLIHVTSFPAIRIDYLSPSYPLLLIFSVLATVLGCWLVTHIRSEE